MRMQKMQLCMSVLYKYITIKTINKHYLFIYIYFGPFHALSGTHDGAWIHDTGTLLDNCFSCFQCTLGTRRLSRRWAGAEEEKRINGGREIRRQRNTHLLSRYTDTGYRTRIATHPTRMYYAVGTTFQACAYVSSDKIKAPALFQWMNPGLEFSIDSKDCSHEL